MNDQDIPEPFNRLVGASPFRAGKQMPAPELGGDPGRVILLGKKRMQDFGDALGGAFVNLSTNSVFPQGFDFGASDFRLKRRSPWSLGWVVSHPPALGESGNLLVQVLRYDTGHGRVAANQ